MKKSHWEALLTHENYSKLNMRIAYQLTPAHVNPKGFQKMNVPLAFQVLYIFKGLNF